MSNRSFPSLNGTCPCKACQAHLTLTPAQRENRKHRKIITHHIEQVARMKGRP